MSNYNDVRLALGASIQDYQPDLNVYYYSPQTLVPPAAIVQPRAHQTIDYLQAQSSGFANWYFNVLLVVGLVDEEAAQAQVGELVSPRSPLIRALQNTKLTTGYVTVTNGGVSSMMFAKGLYAYADLSVVVRT